MPRRPDNVVDPTGPEDVSIPGYEMLEKLGSGSAGTVYKARQISMDRPVAVKVLPAALAEDERFIERFHREARAVAKLNHPNIVTGIDVGSAGGMYYFVMEFVDGEEAGERLARGGALPEAEALKIVEQIARALDHAFRNGIVHRDIKPANIMLTKDGIAKLADLGVAKQAGGGTSITGGSVFGTPYYMSPEQARGEPDIDIRSDIYSLGATLYHLLAGKPPFHGDPPAVVMAKQIAEEPEDIRGLNPKISKAAVALVAHMMGKKRTDRPEMPSDLTAEIGRVAKGLPPPGMRASSRAASHHAHADHGGAARARGRKGAHIGEGAAARVKGIVAATVLGSIVIAAVVVLMLSTGTREEGGKTPPAVTPRANVRVPEDPPAPDDRSIAKPDNRSIDGSYRHRAPPKVDREAEAQKLLGAAMKKGLDPKGKLKKLRETVARFPGTKAAERARRLEVKIRVADARLERMRETKRLRKRAKELIKEGGLASAVETVDPSRAQKGANKPLQPTLTTLRKEILNLAVLAIARAEVKALNLAKRRKFSSARRALKAFEVKGVKELEDRLAQALARVDEVESEHTEAARASAARGAEEAYTVLCEKVNAELRAFRPGEAGHLLNSARAGAKLSPLRDRIGEDLQHVAFFEDVVKAALRGVEMLTGQTRSFAMRNETTEAGTIQRVTGSAIEVESRIMGAPGGGVVSRKVELSRLSDREIADLALIVLEDDKGDTFLKLAVLYSAGGDVRAARRQIEKARGLGADVASVERRWIMGSPDELAAAKLLKQARAHFKAGRYAECRKLLVKLRGEYTETETYKRNYSRAEQGGHVVREYWTGTLGTMVKDLTQSSAFRGKPNGTQRLSAFETKAGPGGNYGARVRGFVLPPADGRYVFWIYSDDASELWLSTTSSPAYKRKIAFCEANVKPRQWTRRRGQESKPVELKRGKKYYIEALHKQSTGPDCLGVGWRLPDGTLERPIPGKRLAPP